MGTLGDDLQRQNTRQLSKLKTKKQIAECTARPPAAKIILLSKRRETYEETFIDGVGYRAHRVCRASHTHSPACGARTRCCDRCC
jgi:hypothetical protein